MPSRLQSIIQRAIREGLDLNTTKIGAEFRSLMVPRNQNRTQAQVDALVDNFAGALADVVGDEVAKHLTTSDRHKQIDPALEALPKFPGRSKALSVVKSALDKAGAYLELPPQIDQGHAFLMGGRRHGMKVQASNYPDPIIFVATPTSNTPGRYEIASGIYHFEQSTNVMVPVYVESVVVGSTGFRLTSSNPPDIDMNVDPKDRQRMKDLLAEKLAEKYAKGTHIVYDSEVDSINVQRMAGQDDRRLIDLIRNNLRRSGS